MHRCQADLPSARGGGFALVTILLLAGIAGLLAVAALRDARFAQALVNAQQFQQRAFVLAEHGIGEGVARLRAQWASSAGPASDTDWVAGVISAAGQVMVSLRHTGHSHLVPGHSVNRFSAHQLEVHASANTAFRAQAAHVQGVRQLVAQPFITMPSQDCLAAPAIPLRVMIQPGGTVHAAELHGGIAPPLRIVDAATGGTLWSAGSSGSEAQHYPAMHAGFGGALAALDLDGDGVHDRLYAGDLAGRIWRLDLQHGSGAAGWTAGGVFADLGDNARAFVAPLDVSLAVPAAGRPWINIAAGTVATDRLRADNRFYVLRDPIVFANMDDAAHASHVPLRDAQLVAIESSGAAPAPSGMPGFRVDLGTAQVTLPSLTVDGQITFAVSGAAPIAQPACRSDTTVRTLDAATGSTATHRPLLDVTLQAAPPFALEPQPDGTLRCLLAGTAIPACSVEDPLQLTWWRVEDAG